MSSINDLIGYTFFKLKVFARNPVNTNSGQVRWDCVCDCGNNTTVSGNNLLSGTVMSCGCWNKEITSTTHTTHGCSQLPLYKVWKTIKQRTNNVNNVDYPNYGGRGITMCDRWKESFENFIEDIGPKPTPEHSIDRENNNGNYEPNNCRWATIAEQANNKSTSVKYEFNGKQQTVAQIAEQKGVPYEALRKRLQKGQSIETASTSIRKRRTL